MKFSELVLAEIVDIVRRGLTEGVDISQELRDIDVVVDELSDTRVTLSQDYLAQKKRV